VLRRGGRASFGFAAPTRRSILILILVRAYILPVRIVIAAVIVVVVVVAVGSCRSGGSHSGSTITRAIVAATITRVPRDWTARTTWPTCNWVARTSRTARYWVTGVWTTSDAIAATAMDASGMNGAAPDVASTHAASMETAGTHAATMKSAATEATTRRRFG